MKVRNINVPSYILTQWPIKSITHTYMDHMYKRYPFEIYINNQVYILA